MNEQVSIRNWIPSVQFKWGSRFALVPLTKQKTSSATV